MGKINPADSHIQKIELFQEVILETATDLWASCSTQTLAGNVWDSHLQSRATQGYTKQRGKIPFSFA